MRWWFSTILAHMHGLIGVVAVAAASPGRESFPGDVFYIHSRLLERSTHLRPELGGGSLTALPIVETEEQNIAAYIPTNLISITDGQVYLSPDLFRKASCRGRCGQVRFAGRRQGATAAYRAVAGDLRLFYTQFEELEVFSRFGSRLDDQTRTTLARGRAVREALKQPQFDPLPASAQMAILVARPPDCSTTFHPMTSRMVARGCGFDCRRRCPNW